MVIGLRWLDGTRPRPRRSEEAEGGGIPSRPGAMVCWPLSIDRSDWRAERGIEETSDRRWLRNCKHCLGLRPLLPYPARRATTPIPTRVLSLTVDIVGLGSLGPAPKNTLVAAASLEPPCSQCRASKRRSADGPFDVYLSRRRLLIRLQMYASTS